MIWIILYIIIASASMFALICGAHKHAGWDNKWGADAGWIICGILWPLCFLPAAAYIAARYYINKEDNE